MEPAGRTGEHARHFAAAGWRQEEARRCRVSHGVGVGAIESQNLEMDVQVERRAEALEERHGAALFRTQVPALPNAPAQLREERSQERAQNVAREAGVGGAAVAQRVGEGEDPLADRYLGEHAIDEVRGGVGHAASAAGGAEAAALAARGLVRGRGRARAAREGCGAPSPARDAAVRRNIGSARRGKASARCVPALATARRGPAGPASPGVHTVRRMRSRSARIRARVRKRSRPARKPGNRGAGRIRRPGIAGRLRSLAFWKS